MARVPTATTPTPDAVRDGSARQVRSEQAIEDEPRRTRRSTLNAVGLPTDIPDRFKKPGFAYSWFPFSVLNEPVEALQQTMVEDGGWEPVHTHEMKGYMPSNYSHSVVEYGGQRLYSRPQYLEDESRMEDEIRARRQSDGRLNSARQDDPRAPHTQGMRAPDETFVRRGERASDSAGLQQQTEYEREQRRQQRATQDPLGGSLRTSADDVSPEERRDIAAEYAAGRGRFA